MSVLGLSSRECSLKKLNLSNNPLSKTAGMRIADDMRTNIGLVSLEIRNNGLCLSVIIALATTLQLSRCLEVLSIDRPLLDISTKQEEGNDHLSRLLESAFCPLQQLSIRYHCIGDIGAKFLSSSLRNNYILTYLDLERNRIGPSGCEALATHLLLRSRSGSKICLKTLLLSYNRIGDEGATALAQVIPPYTSCICITKCKIFFYILYFLFCLAQRSYSRRTVRTYLN